MITPRSYSRYASERSMVPAPLQGRFWRDRSTALRPVASAKYEVVRIDVMCMKGCMQYVPRCGTNVTPALHLRSSRLTKRPKMETCMGEVRDTSGKTWACSIHAPSATRLAPRRLVTSASWMDVLRRGSTAQPGLHATFAPAALAFVVKIPLKALKAPPFRLR